MKLRTRGLTLSLLVLTGCSSVTDTTDDPSGNGEMTARVDGSGFTADLAFASPSLACESFSDGEVLELSGIETTGRTIVVAFALDGEGTYPLHNPATPCRGGAILGLQNGRSFATDWEGASGALELTRITADRVEGTFQFNALEGPGGDAVQVTNGEFNLPRCATYELECIQQP